MTLFKHTPGALKMESGISPIRLRPETLQRCWILAGPTAVGKSGVAVHLAPRLNAEIVALDSMSLYRGMDIGTAKPSPQLRGSVRHHLIDILEPHEEFSLADYVAAARSAAEDILNRGRTPLFVGGTGLYLRGILRGVFPGPPADWEFRRTLQDEASRRGGERLHERLQHVDPAAAAALHPNDIRRIIRALEVYQTTGRPLSEQQRQLPLPSDQRPGHVFWLSPPRHWLYDRINRRVQEMFAEGLLDEVRRLMATERPLSRTARQALGYKEVIDYLQNGGTLDETVQRIQRRTRQFAKRQHTWFRNLEECRPVEMTGDEAPWDLAERILAPG